MPCRMWGLHATRTKRPIVPYSLKHSAHLFRTMSKLNSHEQSKFLNKWLSFRGLFTDRAVEIGPRPWYLEGNLKHRSPKGGGQKDPNAGVNSTYSGCQESKAFSFQRFPNCLDSLDYLYGFFGMFWILGPANASETVSSLHLSPCDRLFTSPWVHGSLKRYSVCISPAHRLSCRGTLESL